jgi:hypothetical protein
MRFVDPSGYTSTSWDHINNIINALYNSPYGGHWTIGGNPTYFTSADEALQYSAAMAASGGGTNDADGVSYFYFSRKKLRNRSRIGISSKPVPGVDFNVKFTGESMSPESIIGLSVVNPNKGDITEEGEGVIDDTNQAWDHYFHGNGSAVGLGPNTVNSLLNSRAFKYRHNRIITGQTRSLIGDFSVNMTRRVFHLGNTNVNYSIHCASGDCNVIYELFVNDGFWDVNFINEKVIGDWLGKDRYQPDGLGPNLELDGGTPYPYIPTIQIYTFPNPGY